MTPSGMRKETSLQDSTLALCLSVGYQLLVALPPPSNCWKDVKEKKERSFHDHIEEEADSNN